MGWLGHLFHGVSFYLLPKSFVERVPAHESKLITQHLRRHTTRNHIGLDGECAATAHGVVKMTLTPPARKHNHAGSQHFIEWSTRPTRAVTAAVERFAATVERDGYAMVVDMQVKEHVGTVGMYTGTFTEFTVKGIGNGVFQFHRCIIAVANEFAVDIRINRKGLIQIQPCGPVEFHGLPMNVVGLTNGKFQDRNQYAKCSAQVQVAAINRAHVTGAMDDALTGFNVCCSEFAKFAHQHVLQVLKGFDGDSERSFGV